MFRTISVNRIGLRQLEDITPPLRNAITIPIVVDNQELVVYVARSVFSPRLTNEGAFVKDVARAIATGLERLDEEDLFDTEGRFGDRR